MAGSWEGQWSSLNGAHLWKPDPRRVQECRLGRRRGTLDAGHEGTVKNLAHAEDSVSEVESKNFQRLEGKMRNHNLDDPAVRVEMAMVMSDMRKPTVGALARLMPVVRFCADRPTLSWRVKLDRQCRSWECLWVQTTYLERRRARSCRAVTYTLGIG